MYILSSPLQRVRRALPILMNNTCSIKLGFTHENQSKKNVELAFIHKIQVSFGNVQYVYIYMLEEDIFSRYCIALLKDQNICGE